MKNKNIIFALLLMAVLVFTPAAFAQTATTRTILSTAVTSITSPIVIVSSATGITASSQTATNFIYVDQEWMQVNTVTGTTLTVTRGVRGTSGATHLVGSGVWFGAGGASPFVTVDPIGSCTRSRYAFLPLISTQNGTVWDCILSTTNTTAQWAKLTLQPSTVIAPYKQLAVTATTYTVFADDELVGYNTNVSGTITLPSCSCLTGKSYTIQLEQMGTHTLNVVTNTAETINNLGVGTGFVLGWASQAYGRFYYNGQGKWFVNNR